jgi:trimeric autotransporter adhesin
MSELHLSISMARTGRFTTFAAGLLLAVSGMAQSAQVSPRIIAPVNENERVAIKGGTPSLVHNSTDLGALPDSTPVPAIMLVLSRSAEQEMQLKQTIANLHNPNSAQYHHWLKPEEFGKRFGTADADLSTVTQWLGSHGFSIDQTSHSRTVIRFSGTEQQVSEAFHTEIHTYVNNGVTFHANNQDPQIPAALSPVVSGLASLNDIQPAPLLKVLGTAQFNAKTHAAVPQWTYPDDPSGLSLVFAPGDFAAQYDVNPIYKAGYTGSGETIGLIGVTGIDLSIVANYRSLFGLPGNLPVEIIDGQDPGTQYPNNGEADLDVELSGAVAPAANIYLYTSAGSTATSGLFLAAQRAVDDNLADVISASFGICEQDLGTANLFFQQIWSQAAAQGQSVFVSSGDSGSAGCDNGLSKATSGLAVNGISSTPYNVSVGGTDFYYSDYLSSLFDTQLGSYWSVTSSTKPAVSLLQTVPEQPWSGALGLNAGASPSNDVLAAGGGGASSCINGVESVSTGEYTSCTEGYAKPSWQSAPGVPADGVRDIPDVSLFASNGYNFSYYPICVLTTDCVTTDAVTGAVEITGVGGTSASSPSMAGIMALIDQAQKGRQGNPNYVLYALANQAPAVFHDVTVGNNNVPCVQGSPNCSLDTDGDGFHTLQQYSAGTGYDLASGLGSVDAYQLLTNWSKPTFVSTTTTLSLSQTSFKHGTPITVSSFVSSGSGTPTGVVGLVSNNTASPQSGLGTITLVSGTAQSTMTSLPAGTYQITAQYAGDGKYATSTSNPVTVTVTPENSTLAVSGTYNGFDVNGNGLPPQTISTSSPLSAVYGGSYNIFVQVYGSSSTPGNPDGNPTGTITMLDNGTAVTSGALQSNGFAEFVTTSLAAGAHSITFTYSGDGSFNAGQTASALVINVAKGPSGLALNKELPSQVSVEGQPYVVPIQVASVAALPISGSVTVTLGPQSQTVPIAYQSFLDGGPQGTVLATFIPTTTGTLPLSVSYNGDSNLLPSTLSSTVQVNSPGSSSLSATTTTLSFGSMSVSGEAGTVTATIKVTTTGTQTPTGNISFEEDSGPALFSFDNGTPLVPRDIFLDSTGTATVTIPGSDFAADGPVQLLALYSGDRFNAPSVSAPVILNVNTGDYTLVASPALVNVQAGGSGATTLMLGSVALVTGGTLNFGQGGGLQGPVALQCATSSPNITCALSSASVMLPTNQIAVSSTTLTINSVAVSQAAVTPGTKTSRMLGGIAFAAMLLWLPFRRRRMLPLLMVLLSVALFTAAGCSGNLPPPATVTTPATTPTAQTGSYTVTVTGTAAGIVHTILVRVNVQ